MKARLKRGPVPISEIITSLSRNLGEENVRRGKVASAWEKIIGKKRAPHAKVATFENGVLTIGVDSSSILYELTLTKEAFLEQFQREFGKKTVKEIRLFYGTGS